MTADPLKPTLFKLDRKGLHIFISDVKSETESTFATVDFRPKNKAKTFEDIIKICSSREGIDQKVLEEEVENQLVMIYYGYAQEEEQKEKAKKENKDIKQDKDEVEKKKIPLMKYTQDGNLFEAVKLAGITTFVTYQGKLDQVSSIEDPERIFVPVSEDEPMPYRFVNISELESYIGAARKETLQSLYEKAKAIVNDYCDIEPAHSILIAADVVFTYFQDRIGMTHYLLLLGLPNTGKGAILETAHQLAYRAVIVASATSASVFRTLGTTEPGQASILIDEANGLTDNEELQVVLKTGYKQNGTIPRVLDGSSAIHTTPTYFKTFGWKIVSAEGLRAEWKAKGFLTRCFRITTYPGIPRKKIDFVITDANPELQADHDKLINLRKLLFAYRLLHYSEPIPSIKLNIDGRDEELCLPLVRLFRDQPAALTEILNTLSQLIIEKQSDKADSLESYLYNRVKEIAEGAIIEDSYELEFGTVWNTLKDVLRGTDVVDKPQSMHTDRFGDISKTTVGSILKKFGAKKGQNNEGKRILRLNQAKFLKFAAMYVIPEGVRIVESTAPPSAEPSTNAKNETDGLLPSRQSSEMHETDGQTVQTVSEESRLESEILRPSETVDFSPLIKEGRKDKLQGYYCTLHGDVFNVNKDSIQHHCRYSEPEYHLLHLEALKKSQLSASTVSDNSAEEPVTRKSE